MPDAPKMQNVRRDLDQKTTDQELASIKVILEKKDISQRAIQTNQFPQGTETSVVTAFFSAALNNFAEASYLEKDWWKSVISKYQFKEKVYCDTETGQFYVLDQKPVETESPS